MAVLARVRKLLRLSTVDGGQSFANGGEASPGDHFRPMSGVNDDPTQRLTGRFREKPVENPPMKLDRFKIEAVPVAVSYSSDLRVDGK